MTIDEILNEEFVGNSSVRDKLFLMDIKNKFCQDANDFVRRVLEDYNYINNGGRYEYNIRNNEESKISAETITKAKELASTLLPHLIQKSVAEISSVISLMKQEGDSEENQEKVETKVIEVKPEVAEVRSNYFNY